MIDSVWTDNLMELETGRIRRWSLSFLAVAVTLASFLPEAASQERPEDVQDDIHVIQKKPVLVGGRVELSPRFGMAINDRVFRRYKAGANLDYHLTERIHVGGLFEWFDFGETLGGRTEVFDKTFQQSRTTPDAPVVDWFGAVEAGFAPIYGKFALFNSAIIYYDLGVTLGGGMIQSGSFLDPGIAGGAGFAGTGSLYSHLYLSDWLALNFRVRDVLYSATLAGPGGSVDRISNLMTVSAGVSLFFPTSFEYSER